MSWPITGGPMPITVTGGDHVGDVKTANINGSTGGIQWARWDATARTYVQDIEGQTGPTYKIDAPDIGFLVGAYLTSYQPFAHSNTAASAA